MRKGCLPTGLALGEVQLLEENNQYYNAASTQPIPAALNDSDRADSYFHRYTFPAHSSEAPTLPVLPVAALRTGPWKFLNSDVLNAGAGDLTGDLNGADNTHSGGYLNGFSLEAKPFTPSSPEWRPSYYFEGIRFSSPLPRLLGHTI